MFYHGRFALLATALFPLSTGCASLQSGLPLQEEVRTLQGETLIIRDEVELPGVKVDYIDDRIDESVDDAMDARFDERMAELEGDRRSTESRPIRQISFLAAYRDFTDASIWDRVDAETALGLEYAHEVSDGLGFEIGTMGSLGTESGDTGSVDVTGASIELYGGARYFFKRNDRWLPYVGGGLSGIYAGVDNDQGGQVADDQDFSLGLYLRGGVQYQISNAIFVGADLRTLFGTDLELETVSGDANYVQLGLSFGFRL